MRKRRMLVICACGMMALAGCGNSAQKLANEQSYRQIGLNQLKAGDYASAIHAFDKALNEHEGSATNLEEDINYYKAYAQMELGDYEGGIETYTALVDYNKKNGDAYYLRGCAYMGNGNGAAALEDFEKAVKYHGDKGEMYAGIYEQLLQAGYEQEAKAYLEKGLKAKWDGAEASFARGRLFMESGDDAQAQAELKNALDEGTKEAALYLGELAQKQGDAANARRYYEIYSEGNTQDSRVLYDLGELAFSEGAYETALEYFKQGMACPKIQDKQAMWTGLIAAMEYTGDFDDAKQEMEAYLEEFPKDGQAQREYIFLKTR